MCPTFSQALPPDRSLTAPSEIHQIQRHARLGGDPHEYPPSHEVTKVTAATGAWRGLCGFSSTCSRWSTGAFRSLTGLHEPVGLALSGLLFERFEGLEKAVLDRVEGGGGSGRGADLGVDPFDVVACGLGCDAEFAGDLSGGGGAGEEH